MSTVSRYLNGHSVSNSAKEQISRAIARLNYTPSSTARNLSLGRRGIIGVVVDSMFDPWLAQLLGSIEEELSMQHTSLMIATLEQEGNYSPDVVFQWIRKRRVDGLIIAKSKKRRHSVLHAAIEAKLPVVTVAPDETVQQAQVICCNNIAAGMAVADHLANLGHREIAFVGGPAHSISSENRLRGLRNRLREWGISLNPKITEFCGSYEAEAGLEFARVLLAKPLQVTALVMANDALALGFMKAAQQHGIRIPQDLSIVGFDNVREGALVWPRLTTMSQPILDMGRTACRTLFQSVYSPVDFEKIEFPMTLVVRESTAE